jgi:hypothetical protein
MPMTVLRNVSIRSPDSWDFAKPNLPLSPKLIFEIGFNIKMLTIKTIRNLH